MKRFILSAFILLLLTLQIGCKDKTKTTESKPSSGDYKDSMPLPEDAMPVGVSGRHGGRLVSATFVEPKTFNQLLFSEVDSQTYNQLMSPGLMRLNLMNQEPEAALAKSWEISEDKLTWTFHLRKGLKWSDGQPFTADDVIFTMQIVNDPNIPSSAQDALLIQAKPIEWSAKDTHTVVAKLPTTFPPFLRVLDGATVPIIAKHKWEKVYQEGKFQESMQVSMDPKDFVSIGAFTLKEYKTGQSLTLKRNPYYWKKDKDNKRLPYLDEIVFLILSDLNQIQLKIESGEVDTYYSIRPEDVERLRAKASQLKIKLYNVGPAYDIEGFFFNQNGGKNSKTGKPILDQTKRAWFSDLNFRKAVSYGINRGAFVDTALYGKGIPAYGPESPSNKQWYNDNITQYPYDPARALELLKTSGFTQKTDASGKTKLFDQKGNPVRFSLHTNQGNTIRTTLCNLIVSDLAKLGMEVSFSPLDFNMLVNKITRTYDYDAILLGLTHDDTDPSAGMNVWHSNGFLHFWWPQQKSPQTPWEKRIDELMNLQATTYDQSLRKRYYDEVQQILSDQQPMIYTITQYIFVNAKESIGNLKPSVARHRTLWNGDELYIKE